MNIAPPLAAATIGIGVLAAAVPSAWDYPGITGLITAIGVFIIGVGGFVVAAILQLRRKVDATHLLVNSVADALKKQALELSDARAEIARLEGEKKGQADERKEPMIPAVIVNETVLDKESPKAETKEVELTPARKAKLKAKAGKAKRRAKI